MKDNNVKVLMVAGVLAAAFLAPTLGRTVPELISFSAGDPVSATDFNSNFDTLRAGLSNLETQVATLEADLATARASAGSVTNAEGQSFPVLRKVITGTKTATTTLLQHGIPGNVATERRIVGCRTIVDQPTEQSINYANTVGSSAALWCDVTDTQVEIAWATATQVGYQVVLEYAAEPFR
jgi:hypothetical protein